MSQLLPDDQQQLEREVTPPELYFSRRKLLQGAVLAGTLVATGGIYRAASHSEEEKVSSEGVIEQLARPDQFSASALGPSDELTPEETIINYNNFYEFTTSKQGVARLARDFRTDGWSIKIDGLVDKPQTISLDDLMSLGPVEERIYRMRCVEAWSIVVPWAGIPLHRLLEKVQPQSTAKYVAFETLFDPVRMPNQNSGVLDWPYLEGLRLDEAMHPLTLLATGLYGKAMPPQDGAPVRLVIPWKYGFKGIKSIVRISLTATEPVSTWNRMAPYEYGFYANVNPEVPHPRWSQATEQRLGEFGRRDTLMFNGYGEQVASLYEGMNLEVNF
ncbi:oxidoreductase molybdopterin binding protein [Pirellula staleyi DSM 6068]|uniref:Protein-methionine-sulfoxide reductase catalytic subunit MsrP n=1 Tax=Pirellula staleyi (strain ATCC 27377 / DSM 6068 / ICPB 4128) TaxID=530564 RepID=D2QW69_PIRSD|nr:protein-methionine-sulfoxide reductase catalytic subunit MsrP [Pirellula staleyi]ADB15944.1 oxidoreductase molybdopterin binding protein [Pirellula staleyi DSM 6068]